MSVQDIFNQIIKLPVEERIKLMEEVLKSIREKEMDNEIEKSVEELAEEYRTDPELTAFTSIDMDSFYETR
jgi:hypothetical protein